MSFAPPRVKKAKKLFASKTDSFVAKDAVGTKLGFIQSSLKHAIQDVEKLKVLSDLCDQESLILDLESKLAHEVNKIKELEHKLTTQNSELQNLLKIAQCKDLNFLFPEEFSNKSLENTETIVQRFKITCKEEIIKVLKYAIKEIHEIKIVFKKEVNEIRAHVIETCPGVLNLSVKDELEILENGDADWFQKEIEEITNSIIEDFSNDIERKYELYKSLFKTEVFKVRNSLMNIQEDWNAITTDDLEEKWKFVYDKAEKKFSKLEEFIMLSIDDLQDCIQCINSNFPGIVENIEQIKEIKNNFQDKILENTLNEDIRSVIGLMKETHQNIKNNYEILLETFEKAVKELENILTEQNNIIKSLAAQGLEKKSSTGTRIQEITAKIQTKFSYIDMNLNAIQESFNKVDELFSNHPHSL